MRVCKRGALYLQIMTNGDVRPCDFSVSPEEAKNYGSLLTSSIYDIYHSEVACKMRSVIENGKNFTYCRKDICRNLASGKMDFMADIDQIPDYPWILNIAYDTSCNYRCKSCIFCDMPKIDEASENKIVQEIQKALPYVKEIWTNGCGEVFASQSILKLLSEWEPLADSEECVVKLYSNGSLFDEKHWMKIQNISKFYVDVQITVHSFNEATYQFLSGTALPVNRVIENLNYIKSLREKGIVNNFEIATVVQERNFREMPEFTRRCIEEFHADTVRLKGFEPWGAMDKNAEWFFNVRNPLHPYYSEYVEVMKDPIFTHPNVLNWVGYSPSLQGDIPAKVNYEVMKLWIGADNPVQKIKDYLGINNIEQIYIYGLSELAGFAYKMAKDNNIKIGGVIDKYTPKTMWEDLKVYKPTKELLDDINGCIWISLQNKEEYIIEELRREGYKGLIMSIKDILQGE